MGAGIIQRWLQNGVSKATVGNDGTITSTAGIVGVSITGTGQLSITNASNPAAVINETSTNNILNLQEGGTNRFLFSRLGQLLMPAGVGSTPSTDTISNFGTYFVDFADRATPASTAETDFSSKTTAANTFAADGDFVVIYAGGNFAANGNSKRYRIYFNGVVAFDSGTAAFNGVAYTVLIFLTRKTSANIQSTVLRSIGTTANAERNLITGQSFTVSNIIKSTGQNTTASANDIIQDQFVMIKGSV